MLRQHFELNDCWNHILNINFMFLQTLQYKALDKIQEIIAILKLYDLLENSLSKINSIISLKQLDDKYKVACGMLYVIVLLKPSQFLCS